MERVNVAPVIVPAPAVATVPGMVFTPGDTGWFTQDRFGVFVHWGLYSMAARQEWVMHHEQIPIETYERSYFQHFDPDLFDPGSWAEAAFKAGMRYAVITAKHHDGFCLWDSALTDYKAPNTLARQDLLRPIVEAFRRWGIRIGLYYSLVDWHHPHYVLDRNNGPYRNSSQLEELNRGRDQMKYADYLHGQVRELLTQFGDVDILWFDFSYTQVDGPGKGNKEWRSAQLYQMIRELRPGIILNDRMDLPGSADVQPQEQAQTRQQPMVDGKPMKWEACQTLHTSWGYHREEAQSYRELPELLSTLIDTVSKNGNLLLNVGPTSRGILDPGALDRLAGLESWMKLHSRSIYGCGQAPEGFSCPQDCRLTYNPALHRLYVHLLSWPYKYLSLDRYPCLIEYAQWLHDGSEATHPGPGGWPETSVVLNVPVKKPEPVIPVLELFLGRESSHA